MRLKTHQQAYTVVMTSHRTSREQIHGRYTERPSIPNQMFLSNSLSDVSRVAQGYGTIAAHTRRRAINPCRVCSAYACSRTVLAVW